ncbi:ATPase [Diaporthe amygdali]|uniref:ATPase n=1 Tax=Phomopsis amygdali TaxID=1214568 RepID=UPI0022FE298A|nr:ATPase [Diaporthe amygdali]KAJ0122128.1 ATPase [Diaporthe amygdali]
MLDAEAASAGRPMDPEKDTAGEQKTKNGFSLSSLSLAPTKGYFRLLFLTPRDSVLDFGLIIVGLFAAIGAGIPFPLLGILFGELVDDLNSTSCSTSSADDEAMQAAVNRKLLLVIYVTIANFALIWLNCGCWSLFGERVVRKLRYRYLSALLRQDLAYFETLPAGDIATRLDADLTTVQSGTSEKVGIVVQSVSYFVTAYIVAFLKDAKLAGILVSLVPCYFLMALGGNYFTKKYVSRVSDGTTKATAIASESLAHMRLIKVFGAAGRIESIFVGHLRSIQGAAVGKFLTASVQMGLLYFIAYCASALAMWQGASFIISQVAPFLTIFANASKSSEKLFLTIQRRAPIDGTDRERGIKRSNMEGDIAFEDVSFNYPSRPEVPVLQKISLSIPSNKMTGVVGLSGSGKSTIAALVERLYDPDEGKITVNGTDLREFNVNNYRGHVAIVEQMPTLFNRSVLENIAQGLVDSGRPEHQDLQETLLGGALAQLAEDGRNGGDLDTLAQKDPALQTIVRLAREAADLVGATEYISRLQHGLATTVGPGGSMLSGGQKQRAAFARAVIRNPSILILDEATAALDSASEAKIQDAMDKFSTNRTTIIIAHRLSTIKNADNILVMERGGNVVEQGTYTSLIERDGVFASLVKLQSLNSDNEELDPRGSGDTTSDITKTEKKRARHGEESLADVDKQSESGESGDGTNAHAHEDTKTSERGFFSTFGAILGFARPQFLFIVFGIIAATIVGGSHSGEAVIFGNVVGRLNSCQLPSEIRESASLFGGLFFGLALLEFFANVISTASFGWVSEKLLFKTRILSLRSLLNKSLHWHDSEGRTPGTLLAYISADAIAMSGMTGTILGITFSVMVNLLSGIILAHAIAWKIALVLLACVPVLLMSGFLRIRVQAKFAASHAKAFADSVAIAIEAVDSIRIISAFSLQKDAANTFIRSLRAPYKATLKNIVLGNFYLGVSFSIGNCVYALAYWWGAKQTANGTYTQTQFFIVLTALLFAAQSSGQIFSLAPDISKAAVASRRVLSLILPKGEKATRVEKEARRTAGDPEQGKNSPLKPEEPRVDEKAGKGVTIALKNVNFAYPSRPEVPVLTDLSLDIPAGSFAALVGPSGAGKSTVVSLLERLYVPASGAITLDGLDITQAPEAAPGTMQASFRDDIALVPQDTVLFSGTVGFNIGLGARPGQTATQAEIETAARLACIHDTIAALPQGYDTPCGPSAGLQFFSGGQKQRLCIARALVRRPRLLLLDESSSALDAESEAKWEAALETIRAEGGVTIVAVAHRLRTIKKAGVIFVIENGRVLDRGTHEELVGRCERYRNDVLHQTLE